MAHVFNIPLSNDFLKNTAAIVLEKMKKTPLGLVVVLPNHRSCRELKKIILQKSGAAFLPVIQSISDIFSFDDSKITFLIVNILRDKNKNIPVNTLYDLAESLTSLIRDLTVHNADYRQLEKMVPASLRRYWAHTIAILEDVFESAEISGIISLAKKRAEAFFQSENIILAGINEDNYYIREFVNRTLSSATGTVIVSGMESLASKNFEFNDKLLGNNLQIEFVPQLTTEKKIETADFSCRSEESFAVACAVRKAVFESKKVLVVSPDRGLAEKIKSDLRRWNIIADDSEGEAFSKTSSGILVSLIVDMLIAEFDTVAVLRALKMCRKHRESVFELEAFLRKQQAVSPNFFIATESWSATNGSTELREMIRALQKVEIPAKKKRTFSNWIEICSKLLTIIDEQSVGAFEKLSENFKRYTSLFPEMDLAEFSVLLKKRILSQSVRQVSGYTDGVAILGVIEAQLLDADFIILAGVNEEAWSAMKKNDFWMTQPMLKKMNIQSQDTKNDFLKSIFERLINKANVLVTRSEMSDGVKQRKYNYFEKLSETLNIQEADWLKQLVSNVKKSCNREIIKFEKPSPRLDIRPKEMWVTDIGLLINNPYAFYAKKILKLPETNYINKQKSIRGNYIHKVLEEFTVSSKDKNDIEYLNQCAKQVLQKKWLQPAQFGLWFFRVKKILAFFARNMSNNNKYIAEARGTCRLKSDTDYTVALSCKADRLDISPDGFVSIIDYKTGEVPSKKQVSSGSKPQLPIEAIIAQCGGFGIKQSSVESLQFWELNGKDEGGKIQYVTSDLEQTTELSEKILEHLKSVINKYNVQGAPYDINIYAPYDEEYMHLARVKEWNDA